MGRRKPSPGICGVCGRAVVRPTPEQLERAPASTATGRKTVCGHTFEEDGRLAEVRCRDHEPRCDTDLYCL
ncbi:MAG TPA: hypothetical protein VGI86_13255 [Acidimicrobiia bacterium]